MGLERLERGAGEGGVEVGGVHDHTVAAGVAHERVRRPEPHRLGVEQRRTERRRFVVLDPRGRVDEVGEAHRVRLGEAVVGERLHLHEQLVGDVAGDPPLGHAGEQAALQLLHARRRTLRAHRLAQLVGLGGREPGDVDRHLHQLLLEQRHPERLAERVLQQRMEVGDRFEAVAAPDVRVHRPALDRAGADQRHLDHEVVELARLEPRQRGHLGPRLDLEHADGVGPTEHGVDVVVLGDGGQIDLVATVFTDEVDGVVQRRQHPETEQVELHEAGAGTVVLVPLQHRPLVHPPPFDGAHLDHRAIADDHAARVDAEVARRVLHLGGEIEHVLRNGAVGLGGGRRDTTPSVDLLRPGILLARLVAERLGHVADRRREPDR